MLSTSGRLDARLLHVSATCYVLQGGWMLGCFTSQQHAMYFRAVGCLVASRLSNMLCTSGRLDAWLLNVSATCYVPQGGWLLNVSATSYVPQGCWMVGCLTSQQHAMYLRAVRCLVGCLTSQQHAMYLRAVEWLVASRLSNMLCTSGLLDGWLVA